MGRGRPKIHGESIGRGTAEFQAWAGMVSRCSNPNGGDYPNYGGRGIRVCKEWQDSYLAFLGHVGRKPSPQHSLDRIDNDGNYEPGNVRWATRAEQNLNRRNNRLVTHNGETRPLAEWVRLTGHNRNTLDNRLNRGCRDADLFRPARVIKRRNVEATEGRR